MIRLKYICAAVLLLLAGFIGGALFQRHVQVNDLLQNLGLRQPFNLPASSISALEMTPLPDFHVDASAFVGLVLGQSNAGSHGTLAPGYSGSGATYQFWQGDFYLARDPLYGSSGNGGSLWMHLAPDLLEDYPAVVWAATVVGATYIADWIPGGRYYRYLTDTLTAIEAESLPVDAVFWIQGESDAAIGLVEERYYQSLLELVDALRSSLPDTAIYLAKATRCYEVEPYLPIRNAVDRAVNDLAGVHAGIDLDAIGLAYRFDGCHLSQNGQALAARQWHELLQRD